MILIVQVEVFISLLVKGSNHLAPAGANRKSKQYK